MKNEVCAVDTNVLIYLHDKGYAHKRKIAENIVAGNPIIPSQVVTEYLNTTKRLLGLPKEEILTQCIELVKDCTIIPVLKPVLSTALSLIKKYDFQLFDSIVVAALYAGCTILYSEDMKHGLLVESSLRIINPFL
jgi:predicted nucleic acid-binding protein